MSVFKVFAAAIEAVGAAQVTGLHGMINGLHVNHPLAVQVNIDIPAQIVAYALEFLCQKGEVELGRIEAGKVAVLKVWQKLVYKVLEAGAVFKHIVRKAVHRTCSRVDGPLALMLVIPGLHAPGLDTLLSAGHDHYKTKLCNAVRGNTKTGALDIEE